jgi:outer membrane immunogenic protein
MKRILLGCVTATVAASLCLSTSAVQAADVPIAKAPGAPVMVSKSWTGFYAGVHGGYAWNKLSTSELSAIVPGIGLVPLDVSFSHEPQGALFGVQIGANYELPNHLVVGVVADISRGRMEARRAVSGIFANPIAEAKIGGTHWTVRGKLGYAFENLLLYATAGIARGSAAASITDPDAGPTILASSTVKHKGWVAGVGADFRLAGNWVLGAEYRYLSLGTENYFLNVNLPGANDAIMPVKWRGHQAIATLNYQF